MPGRAASSQRFSGWRNGVLPLVALGAMGYGLWRTRPLSPLNYTPAGGVTRTQDCLANLGRIALGFAQYAQDYDGKFPRGTDPEDHYYPATWREYYNDARTEPLLHDLLFPYLHERRVWHCPDDTGWKESRLSQLMGLGSSNLHNVQPSSWARFGTSYYYLTIHGFAGLRAADIRCPNTDVVLFDGELWHEVAGEHSVNALFADGHAQNMLPQQFARALNSSRM